MLSIAALSGSPGYYLELTNISYYEKGGEPPPMWAGMGAREFGLTGVADKEHVYRLCSGFDPETGKEKLVRNAGKEERNPGHDLTFSCPKSLSVAWALADDDLRKAIEQAQFKAVTKALEYLEDKAGYARVGTDGQKLVKCPLLFAVFEHGTSRALDPQLHSHALLINVTTHADGRTTAVDSTYLYHFKMATGAMYRAALADECRKIGFDVEQRQLGSSIGFEIRGIPKTIIEEFSKRRAEIEEQLKLKAGSLDAASSRYAELVTKETRRTKDGEKPRKELLDEWKEFGREHGIEATDIRKMLSPARPLTPEQRRERKEEIHKSAIEALSSQHSHWNEVDLTKAVAERAAGLLSARDVRELVENKMRSPELVRLGDLQTESRNEKLHRYIDRQETRFTTPEILAMEKQMLVDVERIVRGPRSDCSKTLVDRTLAERAKDGKPLDPEQEQAVRHLTSGPGVRIMSGLAGTGKTYTLATCHDVWQRDGRDVIGCAVAGAAAKRLEQGTGIHSDTLQRTLWQLDNKRMSLTSKSVVVLDESGMVGTKDLARLMEHAKQAPGARVVLVGDAKQLQPISAGGPHKYLASVLGEVRLENIRRQKEVWARDAVKDFERGNADKAIKTYIEKGHLHVADTRAEAMSKLIDRWKADGGIQNPNGVFLLASLNTEVKDLNLRAQAARIEAKVVSEDKKMYANGVFFHEGDRIQFQKRSRPHGIENSDMGVVTKVEPDKQKITVKLDDGDREVTVDLRKYSGDNLRLGYASTTHKAQGASIPHVHVLMGGSLSDLHMGYVQASRSQESTHLFVDKHSAGDPGLSDLIRSLAQERQKTMAHEILQRQQQELQRQAEEARRQQERLQQSMSMSR